MEGRQEQCTICGQEMQLELEDVKEVLCPDCVDTWQREIDATW